MTGSDATSHGTPSPAAALHAEVAVLLAAQVAAWNRGDLDAFLAGYVRSPELVFTSGGVVLRGYDAARARYVARFGAGGDLGVLGLTLELVHALGEDGACALGRFEVVGGPAPSRGIFTLGLRRTAEGFRVVHDHTEVL